MTKEKMTPDQLMAVESAQRKYKYGRRNVWKTFLKWTLVPLMLALLLWTQMYEVPDWASNIAEYVWIVFVWILYPIALLGRIVDIFKSPEDKFLALNWNTGFLVSLENVRRWTFRRWTFPLATLLSFAAIGWTWSFGLLFFMLSCSYCMHEICLNEAYKVLTKIENGEFIESKNGTWHPTKGFRNGKNN